MEAGLLVLRGKIKRLGFTPLKAAKVPYELKRRKRQKENLKEGKDGDQRWGCIKRKIC